MLLRVYLSGIFLLLFGGLCAQTITEDQFPDFDGPPLAAYEDSTHYYVSGDFSLVYPELSGSVNSNFVKIDKQDYTIEHLVDVNGTVLDFEHLNKDTLIVAGNFTDINQVPLKNLALFRTESELLTTLPFGVNGEVRRVKQINDDYYFFGEFDTVNQSRVSKGAFRYNFKSGELDTFDFAVNGKVRDVVLYDSVIIVGGDFRKINGSQCEPLVLLNREDLSFSESPVKIGFSGEGSVNKLSRYGSMLSVNGSFDWADNVERPNLFLYDLYNEEVITGVLRYTYYTADNEWSSNTITTGFLYGARLAIGAHGVANLTVSNLFHNTSDIHYFCDGGSVERIFMMDSLVLRFGQSRDVMQNMFGCSPTDRMNSVALRHSGFSPALILNNDEYTVCSYEVTDEFEFLILDEQMQTLTVNVEGESGKFESVSKQVNHDLGIVSVQAKLSTDYDSGKVYLSVIDEDGYERLDTVTFFRTPMFETELEFNSLSGIISATPDSVSYTWLLNGDTVKGQTASRLFANANGTYTAIPRNFPCATGGDIGIGTVSAEKDIEDDLQFKVYPNPAEDIVTIEFSDQGDPDRAAIYDNDGRLVSQFQLNKGVYRQELKPGFKPGLYHIALESDNGRVLSRKKLIVL